MRAFSVYLPLFASLLASACATAAGGAHEPLATPFIVLSFVAWFEALCIDTFWDAPRPG